MESNSSAAEASRRARPSTDRAAGAREVQTQEVPRRAWLKTAEAAPGTKAVGAILERRGERGRGRCDKKNRAERGGSGRVGKGKWVRVRASTPVQIGCCGRGASSRHKWIAQKGSRGIRQHPPWGANGTGHAPHGMQRTWRGRFCCRRVASAAEGCIAPAKSGGPRQEVASRQQGSITLEHCGTGPQRRCKPSSARPATPPATPPCVRGSTEGHQRGATA